MAVTQVSEVSPNTTMAAPFQWEEAKGGADHLEILLQGQNQVLEHIVAGADLSATLGQIVTIASRLAAPAHGLLLWTDGDPPGQVEIAPADLPASLAGL